MFGASKKEVGDDSDGQFAAHNGDSANYDVDDPSIVPEIGNDNSAMAIDPDSGVKRGLKNR